MFNKYLLIKFQFCIFILVSGKVLMKTWGNCFCIQQEKGMVPLLLMMVLDPNNELAVKNLGQIKDSKEIGVRPWLLSAPDLLRPGPSLK